MITEFEVTDYYSKFNLVNTYFNCYDCVNFKVNHCDIWAKVCNSEVININSELCIGTCDGWKQI